MEWKWNLTTVRQIIYAPSYKSIKWLLILNQFPFICDSTVDLTYFSCTQKTMSFYCYFVKSSWWFSRLIGLLNCDLLLSWSIWCHQSKFLNLLLLSPWTCNQVVDSWLHTLFNSHTYKAWLLDPIFWFSNWIHGTIWCMIMRNGTKGSI